MDTFNAYISLIIYFFPRYRDIKFTSLYLTLGTYLGVNNHHIIIDGYNRDTYYVINFLPWRG